MVLNTLAFLAGVVALQFCAELPASHWYPVAALAAAPAAYLPRLRLPALWLLGFFWAALHAQQHHDDLLSEGLQGRTLLLQGRVNSIPVRLAENDWRFVLDAERIDAGSGWQPFDRRVRLGWYRTSEQPRAGERWQLAVRLKRPHGYANPGGFDYERWLFQQRIAATGYVREDRRNQRVQEAVGFSARAMRRGLAERLDVLPDTPFCRNCAAKL